MGVNSRKSFAISNIERQISLEEVTRIATASIPYMKGISETITRVLKPLNIRTVCRPHPVKWTMLAGAKDTLPQSEQPGTVYALGCTDCNKVCIGEIGRTTKVRAKEHEPSTRYGYTEKSAVVIHALIEGYQIHWQPHVIERKKHCMRRKVKKVLTITKLGGKVMNQDLGLELSNIWKNLVLQPPHFLEIAPHFTQQHIHLFKTIISDIFTCTHINFQTHTKAHMHPLVHSLFVISLVMSI